MNQEVNSLVIINGENVDAAGMTFADYLRDAGYDTQYIAVERNLEIVPKATFADAVMNDGDKIEIVRFVGGG